MIGVGEWARFWADYEPDAVALIDDHQTVTWKELNVRVGQLGMGLRQLGVRSGDRVATLTSNRVEHFELLFACARAGAVLVPLNPMLTAAEIAFNCEDAGVSVVVTEPELEHLVERAVRVAPGRIIVMIRADGEHSWEWLHRRGQLTTDDAASGDDPLLLCYTSGTTGRPKGAILSHANIEAMASGAIAFDQLTPDDRTIITVPLAYNGGGVSMPLPLLKAGGSVLIRKDFEPARMLDDIERYSITSIGVVPVILERMAREPGFATADLSSWRAAKCGGAGAPEHLLALYQSRGVKLSAAYGLTEAGGFNILLPPQDARRKLGFIGMPVLGQQARVVDANDDEVPPGVRGELLIRGDCVFQGYWQNGPATQEVLRGGWLHTGDVAAKDEEGYYRIVDRVKDMIISGGINIYPAEVESALLAHPDVLEVAVVGMPDPEWGEAPVAFVVTDNGGLTLEDLTKFSADRLARYKRPKRLVLVEGFPRGSSGKVLKRSLREMLSTSGGCDPGSPGARTAAEPEAATATAHPKDSNKLEVGPSVGS
jgi:fatty-acyl-CoA synthase